MAKAKKKKVVAARGRPVKSRKPARKTTRTAKRARRASPAAGNAARLEANKKLVLAFYEQIIGRKDFEAGRRYMSEDYKQHSPYAKDGPAGLKAFVDWFRENHPQHRYAVKKVIAEGDMVVLHLHGMGGMSPHGEQVVDFFRVKDGKVVEHWDVIQPIPEAAENPNGIF